MLKNGFLTFCCAFIPGAGQMYQGYMKRGLSLFLTACLIGMVSSLLNPELLLLVVVWMSASLSTFNLLGQDHRIPHRRTTTSSTSTPGTKSWPAPCWTAWLR